LGLEVKRKKEEGEKDEFVHIRRFELILVKGKNFFKTGHTGW
jgi:hypothetical protein